MPAWTNSISCNRHSSQLGFKAKEEDMIEDTMQEWISIAQTRLPPGTVSGNWLLACLLRTVKEQSRADGLKKAAEMALAGLKGQPKPYSWAEQNYNGGWDQSRHRLAEELIKEAEK
jgi:hypothetical protein